MSHRMLDSNDKEIGVTGIEPLPFILANLNIMTSTRIARTPIPCTYTCSPLDGMARNYFYYYLHGYARSCNFLCLDPFCSYLLIPEEKENIWSELESDPCPFASQATALTTRPWLLGLIRTAVNMVT